MKVLPPRHRALFFAHHAVSAIFAMLLFPAMAFFVFWGVQVADIDESRGRIFLWLVVATGAAPTLLAWALRPRRSRLWALRLSFAFDLVLGLLFAKAAWNTRDLAAAAGPPGAPAYGINAVCALVALLSLWSAGLILGHWMRAGSRERG
jgi:hypothetical protein